MKIARKKFVKLAKLLLSLISPAYRVSLRLEKKLVALDKRLSKQEYLWWINQNREGELMSATKRRIFAAMPRAEGELRETQMVLLEILRTMDALFRENGLSYWLIGGSLLGAVRHSGFIPWDDDADIGMLRKDYEKAKELLKDHPQIELIDFYNFNGFYRIPKIVIKGSQATEDRATIAVDIIVFDIADSLGLPPEDIWRRNREIRCAFVREMRLQKIKNMQLVTTQQIVDPRRKDEMEQLIARNIDECEYISDTGDYVVWGVDNFNSKAVNKSRIHPFGKIFPTRDIEFEGIMLMAPSDPYDMIEREFGDMLRIPPDIGTPKFFKTNSERHLHLERCKEAINENSNSWCR